MDRRSFLKAALAIPSVAIAMQVGDVSSFINDELDDLVDRHNVTFIRGYDAYNDVLWVRATISFPDGTEFHDTAKGYPEAIRRIRPSEDPYEVIEESIRIHLKKFVEEKQYG